MFLFSHFFTDEQRVIVCIAGHQPQYRINRMIVAGSSAQMNVAFIAKGTELVLKRRLKQRVASLRRIG
ncbi:hypothetical protein D3C75_976390 [compost metagenome]